jgi:hypothetical protein
LVAPSLACAIDCTSSNTKLKPLLIGSRLSDEEDTKTQSRPNGMPPTSSETINKKDGGGR